MTTHTDVAHFTAPEIPPTPVNGLIVGYARSATQGPEATARQRNNLEVYSMLTFGRPLDAFYEDFRRSGARMERTGLDALKQDAQNGEVAVIVVEDIERIARSLRLVAEFDAFCDQMMINVHTCMGGIRESEFRGYLPPEADKKLSSARIAAGKARAKALKASVS